MTPTYLWGEAILIATFFINRMPMRVLHFQKPMDVFKKIFPTSRLVNNISLKKKINALHLSILIATNVLKLILKLANVSLLATHQHKKGISVLTLFQENCLCLWM